MKLVELLKKANEGYEDGAVAEYFNQETGELVEGKGDTLAQFVAIELSETFDPDADDDTQIQTAIEAMDMAKRDIEGVLAALSN